MPLTETHLERILRRDRLVVAGALVLMTAASWAEMLVDDDACCAGFGATLFMWVAMMAGMMIPSVAPMVLTHAAIVRRRAARGVPYVPSGLFLAGYLVAWSGFGAVAALAQVGLRRAALLDPRSLSLGPWAGAALLVAAGAFQLSPAKAACLAHCRAPLGYFTTEWREGAAGALRMGLGHGLFCIGCCWLLMAVLFAVGVMNLVWGAAITALVVGEKVLPWRRAVVWSGSALCFAGAAGLVCRAVSP